MEIEKTKKLKITAWYKDLENDQNINKIVDSVKEKKK